MRLDTCMKGMLARRSSRILSPSSGCRTVKMIPSTLRNHGGGDARQRLGVLLSVREEHLVTLGAGRVDRSRRQIGIERVAHIRVDETQHPGALSLHPGGVLLKVV